MPELPEVETMCRGIAKVVGCRIQAVRFPKSRLRPISVRPSAGQVARQLCGQTIAAVGRLGKRVVLELASTHRLVIEPRMTGRVLVVGPPDLAHLRLILELAGGRHPRLYFWDWRGLGTVQWFSADEFARQFGPHRLGPDALEISPTELRNRLASSRRPIKVALMDQRAVAGIGNLYASEILHRAGIHPATRCNCLPDRLWRRLHAAMRHVLQAALRDQGSTLADRMYATAANQPGRYQEHHAVYRRAGERCLRCRKAVIVRIVQAQRSTFFCPRCQPPSRVEASFPAPFGQAEPTSAAAAKASEARRSNRRLEGVLNPARRPAASP